MARRARSLDVLVAEVNALAPGRSIKSDGWLGDPAHQARPSRHNPNDQDVVCAQDITHDPSRGCDIHAIARAVVLDPPADLEYVISDREVAKRRTGFTWEPYRVGPGGNPHVAHAHFAVGRGPDAEPTPPYDDTDPWGVAAPDPTPEPGDDDMPKVYRLEADATVEGTVFKAGYTVLHIGDVRRHLQPGTDHDETVRQWGPVEGINVVAFGQLVASTALDIAGLRSLPSPQREQLAKAAGARNDG